MTSLIRAKWAELVLREESLPSHLHDFQVDLMELVIAGQNVVLKVPTGAGKTLPMVFINTFTEG